MEPIILGVAFKTEKIFWACVGKYNKNKGSFQAPLLLPDHQNW
jgi:hypothetical protein